MDARTEMARVAVAVRAEMARVVVAVRAEMARVAVAVRAEMARATRSDLHLICFLVCELYTFYGLGEEKYGGFLAAAVDLIDVG